MKYRVGITDRKGSASRTRRSRSTSSLGGSFLNFNKHRRFSTLAKKRKSGAGGSRSAGNKDLKTKLLRGLYIFIGIGFFIGCLGIVGAGIYLKNLESSLPDPDKLVARDSALSTQIFDRNGKLLYTIHGDQNREFVELDRIPDHTKWALLAAEDVEFYQHKGLDLVGLAKAAYTNLVLRDVVRGASTISQQLVKNTILYDVVGDEIYQKTYTRKIKEALITMQVEQTLSKDEILQMYMNEVPLGGVNYGFQAAANAYFDKDVEDLTLAESALIAGLIQSPGVYSPLFGTNPDMAKVRQEYVFQQMLRHKNLTGVTEEQIEEARNEELVYRTRKVDISAPHFVFYVKQLLTEEFGADRVERGGLKVTTTLDLSIQNIAEEEIINGIKTYGARWGVSNGAMVVIDPKTGDILSMVGSVDYNNIEDPKIDGNVNVTISPRQMGSSVKPFTYLTAFKQGYGPWLETPDVRDLNFGAYKLLNWDERYTGPMTARQALIQSRNIPAVYTMQLIGIDSFIETAETLGVKTLTDRDRYGLSLTLGAGEMKLLEHTGAYSVFANGGVYREPKAILEVKSSKGDVLIEKEENPGRRVWDEREVYMLNWILCDLGGFGDQPNNQHYFYNGRRSYCGKTGTTDGPRDLTSMMYHKNLVVGVWAGNNNNVATPGAWSTTVPLPIAHSFMNRMAGRIKPESFARPAGIIATSVCNDTGGVAESDSTCKKVASIYMSGKAPKPDKREMIDVCKGENITPSDLNFAKNNGLTESKVLLTLDLANSLQQGNYRKFLSEADGFKYLFEKPPQGECKLPLGGGDAPAVQITSPSNGANINGGQSLTIGAIASAKGSVSNVKFYFNGVEIGSDSSAPYSVDYSVPASSGSRTIMAKVTDNQGKESTHSITVNVTSAVNVSITAPSNGASLGFAPAYSVNASASASGVSKVKFVFTKIGVGVVSEVEDNSELGGWSVLWTYPGAGNYSITAIATKDGTDYSSSAITVTVN